MKKTLFLVSLILLTIPAMSQGKKYKKAMKSAIEQMNKASDPSAELEVAASFEEIAETYPDQWLPSYHASRIIMTNSFEGADGDKRDLMLEHAGLNLDLARALAPKESEIEVLTALYYIGLISVDPETRGPAYYMDAMDAIQKGLELNPENPRAHYMNAMWTLNTPEFMGGGPEPAKPIFLEAAEKFLTYKNEDPFWPAWGEDLVQAELDRMEK
ncbi:MAG: hypothetical protein U9R49_10915 [Bacteroidota bacterium]|nr:hypothetical protein [Bacteroidota bacterium]